MIKTNKLLESEGHNGIFNRTITPTFDNSNEYKKNEDQYKTKNTSRLSSSFPPLPVESDCGSLYPRLGHNRDNNKTASENLNKPNKTVDQQNKELRALLIRSQEVVVNFKGVIDLRNIANLRCCHSREAGYLSHFESTKTREVRCLKQAAPPAHRLMHGIETKFVKTNWSETSEEQASCQFREFQHQRWSVHRTT